ncbi:TolC family protein [bacterium]|nr:TolC family protein [bacterium]
MKHAVIILLPAMLMCTSVMGNDSMPRLSLKQAEAAAIDFSPRFKAKQLELASAQARAASRFSLLWPKLSLKADWRYVTEIGSIELPFPGQPEITLGDNQNYSIGPMLSWMVWDTGGRFFSWKALRRDVRAKQEEARMLGKEIKLKTRLAYFRTQLALEQVRLLGNALKLALAQYQDIRVKVKAGASSRIDELSSHQDVISCQRRLRSARTDLVGTIRDVFNLTGRNEDLNQILEKTSSWINNPNTLIRMDTLDDSFQRLEHAAKTKLDPDHPRVKRFAEMAVAAQRTARSMSAGHWPRVSLTAKTSRDY